MPTQTWNLFQEVNKLPEKVQVNVGEEIMNFEMAQKIMYGLLVADRVESALWFGSLFVWVTIYYILYQMFRLRFLKYLLWGSILYIPNWFWYHRYYFFDRSAPPAPGEDSAVRHAIVGLLDIGIRSIPFCLVTIGAVMALNYLQSKWKEQEDRQQSPEA